jgi:hypothetical protein
MRRTPLLVFSLVTAFFGGLTACGDDGGSPASGVPGTDNTMFADDVPATAACPEGPAKIDLRLADEMDDAIPVITETGHEFLDVKGVRLSGGLFTFYLADYNMGPIDLGSIEFEPDDPPEGHLLVTLFVTAFNAETPPPDLVPGSEIRATAEMGVPTFGLIVQSSAGRYNSAAAVEGVLTVVDIDDAGICVTVDYTDHTVDGAVQKRFSGTFAADVVPID